MHKINDLYRAIKEGDVKLVTDILTDDPALVDQKALFMAAESGNISMVRYLVEYSRISLNEYDENHRNVLHYAAASRDPETFRYLVERCGMDPFEGDLDLVTPWDIVHKNIIIPSNCTCDNENRQLPDGRISVIEEYLENRYGHRYEDYYKNPVRTGFFPDPSICRVGSDYYMVNSSFIFFPCIPISHSRDLIHWEIIGHAITDPKWAGLDELEGGRGYWAPDISYYEGKFYITATYRLNDVPPTYRRQIVVSSERPQGPYSEPVFIDEDGIDPSIFNDDDGRRYMLLNRGARIFELDKTGTKKISEAQLLYYGAYKRAPEGPHLYKKDGLYYLLEAEGGTGPGHRVTVSRSRTLFGSYEPCPYNPIMRQQDEGAAIQRCGHGDLVETEDGRWYMVYLCGRMIGDGYSILGRETAIDPVTWTPDGWPIVNSLKGPSVMQLKPFAERSSLIEKEPSSPDVEAQSGGLLSGKALQVPATEGSAFSPEVTLVPDDRAPFCGLPVGYMTPRPFEDGAVVCGKDALGEFLQIRGSRDELSDVRSRNIVLRRQTDFSFEYRVTMDIPDLIEGQHAGITGYYDENTFFLFGVMKEEGRTLIFSKEHIGDKDSFTFSDEAVPEGTKAITLLMTTDRFRRTLSYEFLEEDARSVQGVSFTTLPDVYYLCDEGLKKGKRFTGALVGMYAYGGKESALYVKFRDFRYA